MNQTLDKRDCFSRVLDASRWLRGTFGGEKGRVLRVIYGPEFGGDDVLLTQQPRHRPVPRGRRLAYHPPHSRREVPDRHVQAVRGADEDSRPAGGRHQRAPPVSGHHPGEGSRVGPFRAREEDGHRGGGAMGRLLRTGCDPGPGGRDAVCAGRWGRGAQLTTRRCAPWWSGSGGQGGCERIRGARGRMRGAVPSLSQEAFPAGNPFQLPAALSVAGKAAPTRTSRPGGT